jgi:hypothetical protein
MVMTDSRTVIDIDIPQDRRAVAARRQEALVAAFRWWQLEAWLVEERAREVSTLEPRSAR